MDKVWLDRIETKLDKVHERINSIDVTLAGQHVSLEEHIRRTELLEKDMAPVKTHVAMVSGAFKAVGLVIAFAGVVTGVIKVLELLVK